MARSPLSPRGAWGLAIVAVLLTLVGLLWPVVAALVPPSASTAPDPVKITDYSTAYDVAANGDLSATEKLTTVFPYGRHGIFRFWDLSDPTDSHVRLVPENISVTLDGHPEPMELSWQQGRRFRVAKIGSANRLLSPGTHVYVIKYTIAGALAPASAGSSLSSSWAAANSGSAFYWNVVPGGWQMDMARSRSTITLPATPRQEQCAAGTLTSYRCKIKANGDQVVVSTGALPPRTPVTFRAALAIPAPHRVTVPWPIQWDMVLGRWLWLAVLLGALSALALVAAWLWARRAREAEPGFPVMYAPPEGMGPVQAYFIAAEGVPHNGVVATLLYMAERGLVKLTENGPKDWTVQGLAPANVWNEIDPVTQAIGQSLGLTQQGHVFQADGSISAGKELDAVDAVMKATTSSWARQQGLLVSSASEQLGRGLVFVCLIVAGLIFFFHPFDITMLGLPFASFVIGGTGLLTQGVGTRRTAQGREAWSRAGGFNRLLSTTSAQDRFDFSAHKDLYTAYIPYAVAFDCAGAWARKYELSTGEQAPVPLWYGATYSTGYIGGGSSLASFESSVRSSIGAYEASQHSSSSGGGGFSGGGGGGGGGGGSW